MFYFEIQGLEFSSKGSVCSAQRSCTCDNFGIVMSLLWNGWCLVFGRKKHPHFKAQIFPGHRPVFYSLVSSLLSRRAGLSLVWWWNTSPPELTKWAKTSAFHDTGFVSRLKESLARKKSFYFANIPGVRVLAPDLTSELRFIGIFL